jgi:glutathione S-transferase
MVVDKRGIGRRGAGRSRPLSGERGKAAAAWWSHPVSGGFMPLFMGPNYFRELKEKRAK